MENHQLIVLGESYIQLNAVGTQFQRSFEGRDRVFRGVGPVAAVGDNQW
jgi:hypothetical protein